MGDTEVMSQQQYILARAVGSFIASAVACASSIFFHTYDEDIKLCLSQKGYFEVKGAVAPNAMMLLLFYLLICYEI